MNRQQLEDRISAILDRDDGMNYTTVLARYRLTPDQFSYAVTRKLDEFIDFSVGTTRETLEAIEGDVNRQKELFNMGEAFIREQYDGVMAGTQRRFYKGSLTHPENINSLVYHALTYHKPQLASSNRKEVIEGIKGLPSNLEEHFRNLGLGGLITKGVEKGKQGSPLAVLEVFDGVYQRETGDVSLFDLTQEEHVHKWGDNFHAPNSYWQNQANVEEAAYHILTENCPELASQNREEVIERIKGLPSNLHDYLRSIGLGGLMVRAFEKGKEDSPLAVLEVFDVVYQRKTGDVSLFDLTQKEHLHKWGDNFHAPNSYWQNQANVKEAIYHTLTENCPKLASQNRKKVIEGIKGLPTNLAEYFHSIGLGGLMVNALEKKNSPLAVLEVFDGVYQRETGDVSLFDLTQKEHLHKWGDNFHAPKSYWQNQANVKEAAYHTLTENCPKLASQNRKKVIEGIKNLPTNLHDYLRSIGLRGLIVALEKIDSPLAVLEVFDGVYQRETGDVSLFDLTQKEHLHKWGDNFKAPQSYWQNQANVKEAAYHTLTENCPKLASQNRKKVIEGIKNLPTNLQDYLHSIGLGGLMAKAFEKGKKESPLAVLEVFDQVYQEKTGNPSLFDKTQGDYLEVETRNRLVRK